MFLYSSRICHALQSVGFLDNDVTTIMSIVASILHLGNIVFTPVTAAGNQDGSNITDKTPLKIVADLLKIDETKLAYVLTHREIKAKEASVFSPQFPAQAMERRDALSRSLYNQLFEMVVERINRELEIDSNRNDNAFLLSIGVLDVSNDCCSVVCNCN